MPAMSILERGFCRSSPWRYFARRAVLPWAMQGTTPAGDVLELGAGSGAMAEGVARAFPHVDLTVTDIDPAMVTSAVAMLSGVPNVTVARADVTDLPYAAASFDIVTSYLMLHHVVDWPRALDEVWRVLRPGGTFVGYDLDDTPVARIVHVVDRSPYRLLPRTDLERKLLDLGFGNVAVTPAFAGQVTRFRARKP